MMRRGIIGALLAIAMLAAMAPSAAADPSANNTNVQYRTFTCADGNTYTGTYVGISANFLLVGTTNTFVITTFTEYLPTGPETFNYGVKGFDPSQLVTCSYRDPAGIYNVFSGFITPADTLPH